MKTERALLISKAMMWTGIILAIIALVGEFLGWWNDTGELLLTIATVIGAVGGVSTIVVGSSSEEVQGVHAAVRDNGRTLDSVDGKLDKLDPMDDKLEKLDDLDVIQAELDQQTGVMERQIRVLEQIRDADDGAAG